MYGHPFNDIVQFHKPFVPWCGLIVVNKSTQGCVILNRNAEHSLTVHSDLATDF